MDEGPAAVPQPLPARQAQVSVNYITQHALQQEPGQSRELKSAGVGECEVLQLNRPKSVSTTLICLPKCFAEL